MGSSPARGERRTTATRWTRPALSRLSPEPEIVPPADVPQHAVVGVGAAGVVAGRHKLEVWPGCVVLNFPCQWGKRLFYIHLTTTSLRDQFYTSTSFSIDPATQELESLPAPEGRTFFAVATQNKAQSCRKQRYGIRGQVKYVRM